MAAAIAKTATVTALSTTVHAEPVRLDVARIAKTV